MPYDDPDPTDPMTLHGVEVETDNPDAHRQMSECYIEEFLRMGFDAARLMHLFRTKGYAGPHLAYQALGEDAIQAMINERIALRGPRWKPETSPVAGRNHGGLALRVLDH